MQTILVEKVHHLIVWICFRSCYTLFKKNIGNFNFYCARHSAVKLLDINKDRVIVIVARRLRFNCQPWGQVTLEALGGVGCMNMLAAADWEKV